MSPISCGSQRSECENNDGQAGSGLENGKPPMILASSLMSSRGTPRL
jgi:hypothetical protein